jgi:probable HAF family extracellular repeat protein
MTDHSKMRNVCLVVVLTTALSFVSPASAENAWRVTPIGGLEGRYIAATDLNDKGQVVGNSYEEGVQHAFITGPNGLGCTI